LKNNNTDKRRKKREKNIALSVQKGGKLGRGYLAKAKMRHNLQKKTINGKNPRAVPEEGRKRGRERVCSDLLREWTGPGKSFWR